MAGTDTTGAPRAVTSIWPAVALLAFAIVAFVVARTYPPNSARFPSMVAATLIVLAALDIWSRSGLRGAGFVETFGGAGFRDREMMHDPSLADQAVCIAWIAGAFALMATIGLLPASAIFCAAFMRLRGRQTLALSATIGLGVTVFLLAVFEWALDYELYRGLAFTEGGVSAW